MFKRPTITNFNNSVRKVTFVRTMCQHDKVPRVDEEDVTKLKSWKEIPGAPSLPIIGQLHNYLKPGSKMATLRGYDRMEYIFETWGPIVRFEPLLGRSRMLMVADPEAGATVLRGENWLPVRPSFDSLEYYKKFYNKKKTPEITGLLTDHGEPWKSIRSAMSPVLLHSKTIKLYDSVISQVADDMIERLKYLRDKDNKITSKFDLEMNLWALESIGAVALGCRLNCLDPNLPEDSPAKQLIQSVHDVFKTAEKMDFRLSFWRFYKSQSFYDAMKIYEKQEKLARYFVKKSTEDLKQNRNTKSDEEKGVLERLLEINEEYAIIMASDMLFNGVDTVANTITFALYMLAKNPEKQNKLREELRQNPQDLKYVKACLNESMRMMPITAGNLRKTTKEYSLLGYRIPKDVFFVVSHEYISMQEDQFHRAKEYLPERWLVPKTDPLYHGNAHPFAMSPFGFGARSCIGRRIAELEIETFLAKFILNFKVEWEGEPINVMASSINYAAEPFNFIFKDA